MNYQEPHDFSRGRSQILREVIIEARETGEMPFTRDDTEKIRKRLKALGYME